MAVPVQKCSKEKTKQKNNREMRMTWHMDIRIVNKIIFSGWNVTMLRLANFEISLGIQELQTTAFYQSMRMLKNTGDLVRFLPTEWQTDICCGHVMQITTTERTTMLKLG